MTIPLIGADLVAHAAAYSGKPKSETVLAAGYIRDNGKPAYTAFYEALLAARGETLPPGMPHRPCPPGGIPRDCPHNGPAIYVACLASYNAGHLYGHWLDLSDGPDVEDIREAIDAVIKESPAWDTEEYAIHDSQGLPSPLRGEHPDIESLADYCQNWSELPADDAEAYRLHCGNINGIATLSEFRDCFRGVYSSPEDFAYDYYDEQGLIQQLPEPLRYYIDWQKVWAEMDTDGWAAIPCSEHRYAIFAD